MKSHRLNVGELEYLMKLVSEAAELRLSRGLKPTAKMLAIADKLDRQHELLMH